VDARPPSERRREGGAIHPFRGKLTDVQYPTKDEARREREGGRKGHVKGRVRKAVAGADIRETNRMMMAQATFGSEFLEASREDCEAREITGLHRPGKNFEREEGKGKVSGSNGMQARSPVLLKILANPGHLHRCFRQWEVGVVRPEYGFCSKEGEKGEKQGGDNDSSLGWGPSENNNREDSKCIRKDIRDPGSPSKALKRVLYEKKSHEAIREGTSGGNFRVGRGCRGSKVVGNCPATCVQHKRRTVHPHCRGWGKKKVIARKTAKLNYNIHTKKEPQSIGFTQNLTQYIKKKKGKRYTNQGSSRGGEEEGKLEKL